MAPNTLNCGENCTPTWLTRDYMQQALSTYYEDASLLVKEFCVTPALNRGENYGSVIYRVTVQYDGDKCGAENACYVVKASFEDDEFAKQKMAPYDFFNREQEMYNEVVPQLQAILRQLGEPDMFVETVKVDTQHSALVFADLKAAGFEMANRLACLDVAHIQLVLAKLAKLHAASVVLNRRQKGALERYDRGFFNRHTDVYKSFFVENVKACARMLSQSDDMARYARKLRQLQPVYMELGARVFDAPKQQLNVLNHGDLWTNNLMFQYDKRTGRPADVLFLDLQCVVWASPAVDLHYLFNTSLQPAVQLERQGELFQYYYNVFRRTLESAEFAQPQQMPSLHRFRIEMQAKEFYALHSACVVQPVMLNEVAEDADYHALMGVDERALRFKDTIYKNPKIQAKLRVLLPLFERLGLLEAEQ